MAVNQELKSRAEEIRDEQAIGANTALRVGGLLVDMVDEIGEKGEGGDSDVYVTNAPNADLDFQDEDGNVIMRLVDGHVKTKYFDSSNIVGAGKEISIFWIGNSLTQDAVSYLPLVLKELAPDLSFKFYIWYQGGKTLTQILATWNLSGKAEIFSVCENVTSWTNFNNSKDIGTVLSTYTFDIVVLEEYFNYMSSYDASAKQTFSDIIEYIRTQYGKPFKVATFFHQPLRKTNSTYYPGMTDVQVADAVFAKTKAGIEWQMENTIAESVVPSGIATYRAMSTSLDSLGDSGHLSPDGTHSQEGLPCLMQAWVTALWVFDQLAIPVSINNAQTRVTTANYSSINVPGPNLGTGVVVGTTAQDRLAMDVAIKAYKEGKYIELNSLTANT